MLLIFRSIRRRYLRPKPILIVLATLFLLDIFSILSSRPASIRRTSLPSHLRDEKIFIASTFRNSEYILRLYWNQRLLNLVRHLGPQNVYVSIVESGSQEDTKGALRDLERELIALGVGNRIDLGIDVNEQLQFIRNPPKEGEDRTGWIRTNRESEWKVRRIPYLAALRNQAMEPMTDPSQKMKFDKILWINDVLFSTEDVTTLLSTRDGDYAAACAIDVASNPHHYYDTFALRDINGDKTASQRYPYFFSPVSRSALYYNQPIPVLSCWNGLISLSAAPFYANPPLKFRGITDSLGNEHLEGSECCLIHSDNPLRRVKGVWVNPNVRVAYKASQYSAVNGGIEIRSDAWDLVDGVPGGDGSIWPGGLESVAGTWVNRWARTMNRVAIWSETRIVKARVSSWVAQGRKMSPPEDRKENGLECLINEMQVLFENGWQHV